MCHTDANSASEREGAMVSGGAAAAGSRLVLESVNPHCLPCDIEQKEYAYRVSTVWGGRLSKRFCNMISGSSPCLLGQHGSAVQPSCLWNSQKTCYKTFSSTCRPRLYPSLLTRFAKVNQPRNRGNLFGRLISNNNGICSQLSAQLN